MKSTNATSLCKCCFKPIYPTNISSLLSDYPICPSCFLKMKPKLRKKKLDRWKGFCLYPYNETIRKLIYDFKGCGDYELKNVFLCHYKTVLRVLYRRYVLVPAPSAESHNRRRGYNHVVEIFSEIGLPLVEALRKTKEVKQSDLHFKERQKIREILELKEEISFQGKRVLFVDDILTSGSTARACMSLIEKAGAKKVRFLILAETQVKKSKNKKIPHRTPSFLMRLKESFSLRKRE